MIAIRESPDAGEECQRLTGLLLYQEWLTTRPWDILLASGIIAVVASVPIAVAVGTWIQKRRADAARRIPWLRRRVREEESAQAEAHALTAFDVAFWILVVAALVALDVLAGSRRPRASKGVG
jgi:hypothetical protein